MTVGGPPDPPAILETNRGTGVGIVTLRRPERRNALSNEMLETLETLFCRIHDDAGIRSVVLAAEGPVFSAGRDLREPNPFEEGAPLPEARSRARLGARAMNMVRDAPQLTIAAVQGPAIGGGAVLAFACDFRILAESAYLSTPEVELGLPLGWDTLPQLVSLAGPARAKWLAAACRRIEARRALEWGFCEGIAGDPRAAAAELAAEFAGKPRVAQSMVKEAVNRIAQPLRYPESEADQLLLARSDRKDARPASAGLPRSEAASDERRNPIATRRAGDGRRRPSASSRFSRFPPPAVWLLPFWGFPYPS